MSIDFEIKSVDTLLDILEYEKVDTFDFEIVEFNQASLYRISGKRLILLPSIGNEGILYYSELAFNRMLAEKHFPTKDEGSLFLVERDRIEKLPENVEYFINILSYETQTNLSIDDEFSKLDVLSQKIKKMKNDIGSHETYRKLCLALGVYLGEIIRKRFGTQWQLEQYLVMNPYWIANLDDSAGYTFNLWEPIEDFLLTKKYSNLQLVIKNILIERDTGIDSDIDPIDNTSFDGFR